MDSQGGMAAVMKTMILKPPNNWEAGFITTHSDASLWEKIRKWRSARIELRRIIEENGIDVAHIHVTHSMSWWRKVSLMRICRRNSIPILVHIHSGRFQEFCSGYFGIPGASVRKALRQDRCETVVLEERWLDSLNKWIPQNCSIINNYADEKKRRIKQPPKSKLKILMIARNSKGKGHLFAVDILRYLISKGADVEMTMTGENISNIGKELKNLNTIDWVSDEEKDILISESDFLILPSEFEGSSMSVIESMINGLPCLVSSASAETVGIQELILPLDKPEEWGERILFLSKEREYLRIYEEIKKQSERFNPEVNRKKWEKLYNKLTKNE